MPRADHLGRDLLVAVRRGDGAGTLRAQLEGQLRDDVRAGRLRPGEPLPSSRALARELGVSRGVVVEAYAQLLAEGVLEARPGSGTRVAAAPADAAGAADGPSAPRWDLRAESADLGAFPRRAWLGALRRALETAPDGALTYGDPAGAPTLRAVLAGYLGRARGVRAVPGEVVVSTGMTQGLALVAAVLRDRGATRVGVEDPGFPLHRLVLRRAGLETVRVPVDDDGVLVDALDGLDALLVTPQHQMPTGAQLSDARRAALDAWDGWVLEDDYDGEVRHDGTPSGALQGRRPERTVYLGSVSKALAPALRLGWVVAPADLAADVAAARALSDGGGEALGQLALADLVTRGELDRHLRRMRTRYRRRRDALLAAVAEHLPQAEVRGAHAGLHVHATLPGLDPDALPGVLERAWAAGAGVVGYGHGGRAHLVLGYANLPEPGAAPALRALARALAATG